MACLERFDVKESFFLSIVSLAKSTLNIVSSDLVRVRSDLGDIGKESTGPFLEDVSTVVGVDDGLELRVLHGDS